MADGHKKCGGELTHEVNLSVMSPDSEEKAEESLLEELLDFVANDRVEKKNKCDGNCTVKGEECTLILSHYDKKKMKCYPGYIEKGGDDENSEVEIDLVWVTYRNKIEH